jgi:hypothetical protein
MILKHIRIVETELNSFFPSTQAHQLLEQYTAADNVVVIVEYLWEPQVVTDKIKTFVAVIKEKRPWKILLVTNSWDRPNAGIIQETGIDDALYVDYFLYRVYKEVVVHKKSAVRQIEKSLTFDKQKFLFLTGKAGKVNRIGLLKKFVDAGLMTHAEWSFYYFELNKQYNRLVRDQLPDLTDEEFKQFVKTWSRNPDTIDIVQIGNKLGYEYNGIPYSIDLYTQTDFSVISESSFLQTDNPWITEKTWIPILNKHPFIIAGDTNILQKLEQMGFETFRDFLKIPDYDKIVDTADRLAAVVENTQYFLDNIKKNSVLINHDISQNYSRLTELYFLNNERILNFMHTHQLTEFTIDDIVPTAGRLDSFINKKEQDRTFALFYNNVKDSTWPDAKSIYEFYKLPEHIQRECIDTFGLVLPTK